MMALFITYYCPRQKKQIAFCNEPMQENFVKNAKLFPVPCIYLYGGLDGVPVCQHRIQCSVCGNETEQKSGICDRCQNKGRKL